MTFPFSSPSPLPPALRKLDYQSLEALEMMAAAKMSSCAHQPTVTNIVGGRWYHEKSKKEPEKEINVDYFDDSYRHKFWLMDGVLLLLGIGGTLVAVKHAVQNEDTGMLTLGFRTFLFALLMDLFFWLPSSFVFRTLLLKRWMKVSDKHYHQIMANRDDFCLQELKEDYTELKLKKFDCMSRKIFHFLYAIFGIAVEYQIVSEGYTSAMAMSTMLKRLVWQMLYCILLYGNLFVDNLYVQSWMYYAPRIRDGREAYINVRVAAVLTAVVTPVCNLLLDAFTDCGPSDDEVDTDIVESMVYLVFLPVALGDAMGEIIGSFYGKHTFAVKGFGEVNKKSLEGCAAVFLSSLGITLLSTFVFWPDELPLEWKVMLPICVSALSTLTETLSFRSTDNFVIPFFNAILVILVYKRVRDEC